MGCHRAVVAILSPAQPGSGSVSIPAPSILVSPADKVGLQLDAVGVFTALGLNEKLFAVSGEELGSLVSAAPGAGPPPPGGIWGCGASIAAQGWGRPSQGRGWCCLPCCGG